MEKAGFSLIDIEKGAPRSSVPRWRASPFHHLNLLPGSGAKAAAVSFQSVHIF